MASILKSASGINNRWTELLQHHFPHDDLELGECLLTIVAYVVADCPQTWVKDDPSGPANQGVRPLQEAQTRFQRQQGDIASMILAFQAWDELPKREKPRWCQHNYVNGTSMSQIQEARLSLKKGVESTERSRSLRSDKQLETSEAEQVLDRLALLLLQVFPDCVYMKWHTQDKYLNCTTTMTHPVESLEVETFGQLGFNLPEFILCFSNIISLEGKENLGLTPEVSVSFVISEAVSQKSGEGPLIDKFPEIKEHMPVKVELLEMGDAMILHFVGSSVDADELKTDIRKACSREDMLLSVDVYEPDATHTGWALEIYCPAKHEKRVKSFMWDKVLLARDLAQCEADTVFFPYSGSTHRLLLQPGGQIQAVPNGQHLVMVHIVKQEPYDQPEKKKELHEYLANNIDLLDSDVSTNLEMAGKIRQIERIGNFPSESLWGAVWFEYQSAAVKAVQIAKILPLHENLIMKLVLVETEALLFSVKFHWWKTNVVENRLELHFSGGKDLQRFKGKEDSFEDLRFEYDNVENKVTITSEDADPITWQDMFEQHEKKVFPKVVNYKHEVKFEAEKDKAYELVKELPTCLQRYFPHIDMIRVNAQAPEPGASDIEGFISSYSATGLTKAVDSLSIPDKSNQVCGGEFSLSPGVSLKVTAPIEVLKKVETNLKAFLFRTDPGPENDKGDVFGIKDQTPGTLIKLTVVFRGTYDFSKLKAITRSLKPRVIHVRGEVLTALLAVEGKDKEPRYIQIMIDTDTHIQIIKSMSAINIYGERENVEAVRDRIRSILSDLGPRSRGGENATPCHPQAIDNEECPVCERDITGREFRLSLCGHLICHGCFKRLIEETIEEQNFPITCYMCCDNVLFRDIEAIFTYYNWPLTKLLVPALQSLETQFPCCSNDCSMMYHDSEQQDGGLTCCFTCPLCSSTLCTACFCRPYHFGLNCTVSKALETVDAATREWLDADPSGRKLCPKCLKGIEKSEDRPSVYCRECSVYVCWECLVYGSYLKISTHLCIPEDAEW